MSVLINTYIYLYTYIYVKRYEKSLNKIESTNNDPLTTNIWYGGKEGWLRAMGASIIYTK